MMWFSTVSSANKWASNATWQQGRSEQPKTQKNILDPTISAPQSAPPKIVTLPQESQLRLLEALVKEIKTPVTEHNPPEYWGSQSSTCSNRTIQAPPEGLNHSTTSLQELLDKHSDTTQMQSTSSGVEKQSGSGLGKSSLDNESQQSCQSKGKQKAIDVSSPLSDPHILPSVRLAGFLHVTSTLEGHQSAITKRIEDDVKEICQMCMRTQEQQRNLSCEHYAKSKFKRKKCAGFVPDPKDDCVDAPTDHSKVTYNAFKACIHQHAHHLLKVSDYRLLTSSNCSITEDGNFVTKFNIDAILVFALNFIEKTTKFAVQDAFYSHFKTIQDYYKDIEKVKNGMSMEELKDKKQLELKKSARQSRKNQEAGSAGCSSDESESEPDQEPAYLQKAPRRAKHIGYRRIEPIWWGTAFRSLMYCIDDHVDDLRSLGVNSRLPEPTDNGVEMYRVLDFTQTRQILWYNSLPLEAKLRLDIKDWDWDFCNGRVLEVEGAPQTGHGDYCVLDPSDPFGQRRIGPLLEATERPEEIRLESRTSHNQRGDQEVIDIIFAVAVESIVQDAGVKNIRIHR
ncbi:uncharacterized protein F5147DRAFT_655197 [Suillus discolor]|uniref:Uncharacterized protein n=1 Tax=Suillus discolor TaxID=1912936 RepID=A0A9P7JRG9_9AGAM|nr:uncharacterized protein F5147DRAFT_655197 [Suillus discolor]KAG2101887.1 hypothetical protein F5147DRAFT_655197 [Suillus discolor]